MIISGARLAKAPIDILQAGMSEAIAQSKSWNFEVNFRFARNKSCKFSLSLVLKHRRSNNTYRIELHVIMKFAFF